MPLFYPLTSEVGPINWSLSVHPSAQFLHDCRGQYGALFELDCFYDKNFSPGLKRIIKCPIFKVFCFLSKKALGSALLYYLHVYRKQWGTLIKSQRMVFLEALLQNGATMGPFLPACLFQNLIFFVFSLLVKQFL